MKHPKVKHWDDERHLGNSLIVTTAPGWAFWPHQNERFAEHVRGFETIKAARDALKWAKECKCQRCLSNGREG